MKAALVEEDEDAVGLLVVLAGHAEQGAQGLAVLGVQQGLGPQGFQLSFEPGRILRCAGERGPQLLNRGPGADRRRRGEIPLQFVLLSLGPGRPGVRFAVGEVGTQVVEDSGADQGDHAVAPSRSGATAVGVSRCSW
ncbi:hypothetical protein ADK33_16960 [Streptomyces griseus subsp. rhodochrous]|nr:hypothetical protein ADK33_16960 [Streptomyces griseus subsp. rhodochrous]